MKAARRRPQLGANAPTRAPSLYLKPKEEREAFRAKKAEKSDPMS